MKKLISSIFDKDKTNLGRQCEVDLLRGFTFIILVICHVGYYLTYDFSMYTFSDIIGSEPAAPVFMILLGISVIYSRHQNPGHLLKRGLILFIGGYLLNLIRSFPYWIFGELDYFACVPGFFIVDIYQFAGLAFILFALFKKLKMPSWAILCVSIGFLIVGQILMANPSTLKFPKEATYVLNLFLPIDNDWCCFNLLTWFIYPSFGLVFGELLIRCKNKNKFYLILLCLGLIGVVTLTLNICLRYPEYTTYYFSGNFYRMGVGNSVVTILIFCFLISLWYFIGKILPSFAKIYLSLLSKNISYLYVVSWIEISILLHVQVYNYIKFSNLALIGFMVAVLVTCSLLVLPYQKIKSLVKITNKNN